MNLSNRATAYLSKQKRDSSWTCSRDKTIKLLQHNGFAPYEAVVDFQVNFSGYQLTIGSRPNLSFNAKLFSAAEIAALQIDDIEDIGGSAFFSCGEHSSVPCNYAIRQDGQLCANCGDEDMPPFMDSYKLFIEDYALRDYYYRYHQTAYYELKDYRLAQNLLTDRFQIMEEASGIYNEWWANGPLLINIGTWLEQKERYIQVMASHKTACTKIVNEFKASELT